MSERDLPTDSEWLQRIREVQIQIVATPGPGQAEPPPTEDQQGDDQNGR